MAEVAGLAVGAVALAGLFNNAVDCFEYVQIGRNFGVGFQTSLLKLRAAEMRLSRWGESVGLGRNLADLSSLPGTFSDERVVRKAERQLAQILRLFADAEGVSKKYSLPAGNEPSGPAQNREALAGLAERMRDLSVKRQNKAKLTQKIKWALHQQRAFKELIEDIRDLTKDLEELFPARNDERQQLAASEVVAVASTPQALESLKEAAEAPEVRDEALLKAVEQKLSAVGGHGQVINSTANFSNSKNDRGIQAGQISGNVHFSAGS